MTESSSKRMCVKHAAQAEAERIKNDAKAEAERIIEEARQNACTITKTAEQGLKKLKEQMTLYRSGVEALDQQQLDELRDKHVKALQQIREAELMLRAKESLCRRKRDFECSLSLGLMRDPVVFADGFSYERQDIARWIEKHGFGVTSPLTGEPMAPCELRTNKTLKKIIDDELESDYRAEHTKHHGRSLLSPLMPHRSISAASLPYDNAPAGAGD
jgi:hypothetical protein